MSLWICLTRCTCAPNSASSVTCVLLSSSSARTDTLFKYLHSEGQGGGGRGTEWRGGAGDRGTGVRGIAGAGDRGLAGAVQECQHAQHSAVGVKLVTHPARTCSGYHPEPVPLLSMPHVSCIWVCMWVGPCSAGHQPPMPLPVPAAPTPPPCPACACCWLPHRYAARNLSAPSSASRLMRSCSTLKALTSAEPPPGLQQQQQRHSQQRTLANCHYLPLGVIRTEGARWACRYPTRTLTIDKVGLSPSSAHHQKVARKTFPPGICTPSLSGSKTGGTAQLQPQSHHTCIHMWSIMSHHTCIHM